MGLLRRVLTGSGRLPAELRADLEAEGLLLLAEELPGTVTYRGYRAPGERSSIRKELTTGAVALTAERVLVWTGRHRHVDVPAGHPLRPTLEVSLDRPDRFCLAYDPHRFRPETSGRVEVRLTTPLAPRVVELLQTA